MSPNTDFRDHKVNMKPKKETPYVGRRHKPGAFEEGMWRDAIDYYLGPLVRSTSDTNPRGTN